MTYMLLSEAPDRFEVPISPSGYWLLIAFEITLRRENGETALVLIHSSYAPKGPEEFRPGILSPPYVAFPLDSAGQYLRTACDIRNLFSLGESAIDIDHATRTSLYLLGLTSYTITRVGELIEYKESFREPGKYKCYKMIRLSIQTTGDLNLINLTDPLVLSGLIFLPLPVHQPTYYLTSIDQGNFGVNFEYQNVPLSSNLCRVIESETEVAKLHERAIPISDSSLRCEYSGYLVKCDIAGSGRLSQWLTNEATPFSISNEALELTHEAEMHNFFLHILRSNGFPHTYLLGDGFLAGRPNDSDNQWQLLTDLKNLCRSLETYCARISAATKGEVHISYRVAVLETDYLFGRFTFLNDSCYFLTPSAIAVTRIEDGLKRAHAMDSLPTEACIVIEGQLAGDLAERIDENFELLQENFLVQSKESEHKCSVFRLRG